MSDVCFRMRKFPDRTFGGFYLEDGPQPVAPETWHVGDVVSVMFEATNEQKLAVQNMGREGFSVCNAGVVHEKFYAHIPCRVVERRHSIAWKEIGKFRVLGMGVTLEAETGLWEDLLAWLIVGQRPEWAAENAPPTIEPKKKRRHTGLKQRTKG